MDELVVINVPNPSDTDSAVKRILDLEKRKPVRASSYSIAASNSSESSRNSADFVVPEGSESAEEIINLAVESLPVYGGKITLLEGAFTVSDLTAAVLGVTLEGQGSGTVIVASSSMPPNTPIIGSYGEGNIGITITNLKLDGGQTNAPLLELNNASNSIVEGVFVDNTSSAILVSGGKRNRIAMCQFGENCTTGVHLAATSDNIVESNDFDNLGTSVLLEVGTTKNKVIHNNLDLQKSPIVNNGSLNKIFNINDIRYTFLSDQDPDPAKGDDGDIWMKYEIEEEV